MKSLDQRLSEVISPYDEVDIEQDQLMVNQNLMFLKDSVLESIGTRYSKIEFDLHFEDIKSQLPIDEFQSYIKRLLDKLDFEYNFGFVKEYILRTGLVEQKLDEVSDFVKYIIRHEWIDSLSFCLPLIDLNTLADKQRMNDLFTAHYFEIKNKIINTDDVNPYLKFHFDNCSSVEGVKTLTILVLSDLPGVISTQLIRNK